MSGTALRLRAGDLAPSLVLPLLAAAALPMMSFSTWLTFTVAGIAMGMMLFLMASGLTLIFGLMDVLNFAHGAFITLGAYVAVSVMAGLAGWSAAESWWLNLAALFTALVAAVVASGTFGLVFERVIIRRVYGAHLRQILVTVGGLIVAEQLIVALWGANPLPLPKPASFRGSIVLGDVAIEKYRIIALVLGLAVYIALHLVLNRTRIGLLVRAGVENREMVEALGYRIQRLFIGVFVAGTALAGMGGVMWGIYQELVTRAIGADMTVLVFIILIIGGLGSVGGCFVGALLVGLLTNYVGFLAPKLALGSNILLMAAILLWRPRGLFPVTKE
ncbi:MAG TPA: branched-chain amino acid ABC transporter permease [Stellaceae bacterium]|nr:branched-chain amino acid ABC transporter permease [Stellaceae bacterium]